LAPGEVPEKGPRERFVLILTGIQIGYRSNEGKMDIVDTVMNNPALREQLVNLSVSPLAPTPILFAKIKLLWQCNLNCTFCERRRPASLMNRDQVFHLLNTLKQQGLIKIHFSGGEIFLYPGILEVLKNSCDMGLQVNLTSNGTLIDREIAFHLCEMGVHSISISLDSANPQLHDKLRGVKGAFKKTLKALCYLIKARKKLKQKRPALRVNTVVCRDNVDELEDIHQLLKEMGPDIYWKLLPVDAYTEKSLRITKDQAKRLLKKMNQWPLLQGVPLPYSGDKHHKDLAKGNYAGGYYENHPCYIPWLHLFIDPEGYVYPCCMTRGRIAAMGKLPEQSLQDIIAGEKMQELRLAIAAGQLLEICRRCDDFLEENAGLYHLLNEIPSPEGEDRRRKEAEEITVTSTEI